MHIERVMVGRAVCCWPDTAEGPGMKCTEWPIVLGHSIGYCGICKQIPEVIPNPPGIKYDVIEVEASDFVGYRYVPPSR